jgi:hypothetical protein
VLDGFESVTVNVVSVGGGTVHVSLDKTEGACSVYEEVAVAKF